MATPRGDYDSPWKEILERFLPQFVAFFFPAIHNDIDWQQGYQFLDKELQQVVREAETGRHTVDKLVKVTLKEGKDVWLLIHIEVQSQVDPTFARRTFVANYRLFDRYGSEVISLGILADEDPDWRPNSYGYGRWGSEMRLHFPTVKLLGYAADWEALEQNPNPFAVVVMAHVKTQATRGKAQARLRWKIHVVKGLYQRGYKRKDVLELLRFIDWVMALPPRMERGFWQEVHKIEEADKMRYVMSIERIAMQDGIEQGSLITARASVMDILNLRFYSVPDELIERINDLTNLEQLKALLRLAATVGTLEEFERATEAVF